MKKLVLFLALVMGICQLGFTQAGRLSQRNFAPLLINPASPAAQTDMKLMLHYNYQQFHAGRQMENTLITALYPFFNQKGDPSFALGFSFFNEQENGNAGLNRQSFDLAGAYALKLPGGQYLSLGMQVAYRQFSVRTGGFTTGSQWEDNFGYNPGLPTGEIFLDERPSYFDMGTGAVWYALNPAGKKQFFLSLAAYRINRPSVSLISSEQEEALPFKWMIHGGYTVWANDKFEVIPELFYLQEGIHTQYNGGATLRYSFQNENPFDPVQNGTIGLTTMMDQNGTLRFSLLFEQPQYEVGLAYDFSGGQFGQAQASRNSAEIAVSIRKSLFKPKKKRIKADRYVTGEVRIFELDEVKSLDKNAQEENKPVTEVTNEDLKRSADPSEEEEKEDKFKLAIRRDFNFGFNEVTLSLKAKSSLEDIFLLMEQNKVLKLQVIGHTDNQGTATANQEVSLARAAAVVNYLQSKGIDLSRMEAIGMGDDEPLYDNDTEVNRAKNRRVEFILYQE